MFYLCDINMIAYLTILTGQVIQKCWVVNKITFTYQILGWSRGDGLSEKKLCICNTRQ